MKVLMIAPKTSTFINFRGDLIRDMVKHGCEVVVAVPESGYETVFEKLGAKQRLIHLEKNSLSVFGSLSYMTNLKRIMKEERPDKVFSYTIKPVIFGSLAAKLAKVPEIYSMVTGLGYLYAVDSAKTKLLRAICGMGYRLAFHFNKRVIFQNKDDITDFVKRHYLKREKCCLVDGSGVNLEIFKRNALPEDNHFLMVSRVLKQKGVLEYFEAAKMVKEVEPKAKFTYIGAIDQTSYSVKMEQLVPYIEAGIVEYIPETNDVAKYQSQARFFVLPSYYREGIPRTLLEALAMGRPILTTDTVGCREAVEDQVNGLFVKPKDAKDLAEKMLWMMRHPEDCIKMGEAGYELCKRRFDVRIINREMLSFMEI
ncbi:N, N'-diacetylbacillosaminyl-diphospho-undecaprenol alpha-1,3-N-acetylgalactosaminyltransferase [Eubacteriaceae bacterium CHKCI005]|nr:N, N'-diacetylbacillosaminyl-diphospho-undecaprenol alpha-1,3-N-acetylgalactosaminyltransferase [Eubacteriaceae bacterium CHKCI005]